MALTAAKTTVQQKLKQCAELIQQTEPSSPEPLAAAASSLAAEVSSDCIKSELVPALLQYLVQAAGSDKNWAGWGGVIATLNEAIPSISAALLLAAAAGVVKCKATHTASGGNASRAQSCVCCGLVSAVERLLPLVPSDHPVHRRMVLSCLRSSQRSHWVQRVGQLVLAQEVHSSSQIQQTNTPACAGVSKGRD